MDECVFHIDLHMSLAVFIAHIGETPLERSIQCAICEEVTIFKEKPERGSPRSPDHAFLFYPGCFAVTINGAEGGPVPDGARIISQEAFIAKIRAAKERLSALKVDVVVAADFEDQL